MLSMLRLSVRNACLCILLAVLTILGSPTAFAQQSTKRQWSKPTAEDRAGILEDYGKLPLSFEINRGQTDAGVKFLARTGTYSLFLTGDEAIMVPRAKARAYRKGTSVRGAALRMKLEKANPAVIVEGRDKLSGTANYFVGSDPGKWRTGIPTFAKVNYEGIYRGIDLIYYGNRRQLEYDFVVGPGADPRQIAFDIRGAQTIRRSLGGDLVFKMSGSEVRWRKPVVYQQKDGVRQEIAARYVVSGESQVTFEIGAYDATRGLYIDPLVYSTYLGGPDLGDGAIAMGTAIAVDANGYSYVTGTSNSPDFPTTPGAFDTACCGSYITKINPAGTALVYSTFLQGAAATGIAVDSAGDAYVVGSAPGAGTSLPTTAGAFESTCGSSNSPCYSPPFVTKLNPAGTALVYSTYVAGGGGIAADHGLAIAVDGGGNAYISGSTYSPNFPVTPGAFQPTCGTGYACEGGLGFVAKLNSGGSALVYGTYLGAGSNSVVNAIATDGVGNTYVTGATCSSGFPVTAGGFQTTYPSGNCGNDPESEWGFGFVTKFNPTGTAIYSSFLSGSGITHGLGIAADSTGNAYVTGYTLASDFPTTPGAFQTVCNRGAECSDFGDAFVTKVNPTGTALVYSTYLGGSKGESGNGIAVDGMGDAFIAGSTQSTNFPTANAFQAKDAGGSDVFVSKLNPTGSTLVFSTYLGGSGGDEANGIAIDGMNNAYVTGYTLSSDFPTTTGAYQTTCSTGCAEAFVSKILATATTTTTLSDSPSPSTLGEAVTLTGAVNSVIGAPPDGEILTFMEGTTVLGTGALSGGTASLNTSKLALGTDSITAVYGGDTNLAPSTSKVLKQVVGKAVTSTSFASNLNPSIYGQAVTWTATVTTTGPATPTGKVTFTYSTTSVTDTVNASGVATYTTSKLAAAEYGVEANYKGDTNNAGSTSPVLNQTVGQATSSTALVSSLNPSTQGKTVTFTATVSSPTVVPTGPVAFAVGGTVVATVNLDAGKAAYKTSTLPVGSTTVTATYAGNSSIGESAAPVTQVVQQ